MSYNSLNSIINKELTHQINGVDKGYTLDYTYNNPKHPHAPSQIANSQSPVARRYEYDGNGNPTYYDEFKSFRSMLWDEENRLRGLNDNGKLHLYSYDHTGERALKSSAESSMAVINGASVASITHTDDYTAYISPYFVVNKGKFTKHFFEGSSRIVSKLGEGTFVHKNTGITAGGVDYLALSAKMQEARDKYIKGLKVPPGPPTQHGIYASPEWTGNEYPSIDWQEISQNQEPPNGWPRYPRFNDPGDVPGPPVQFGNPITNANVKAGYGFVPNGVEEKNLYYYHPDHLGSSSYITDKEGRIIQHTEYMAFGEVLFDEHSVSKMQPYLFNGKELDMETGLYYYGARYYDPKVSLWLNTDPLSGYNPIQEVEHYIDGQHNGGVFNFGNLNTYTYTYQNPVVFIDPNGKQVHVVHEFRNVPVIHQPNPTFTPTRSVPQTSSPSSGFSNALGILGKRLLVGGLLLVPGTLHAPTRTPKFDTPNIDNPSDGSILLYRGVATNHDKYGEALLGIAVPGNDKGEWNPRKHNRGKTENSVFTSWTTDEKVANYFGTKNGERGVVLKKKFNIKEVIPSPDFFHQGEWLVPGIVKADDVKTANPNNVSKYKSNNE